MTLTTPAVYVGTYLKYNESSLFGKWFDLNDFDNVDDFYLACAKLHDDESDPEIMFQDWQGIPEQYISESGISSEYWDYLQAIEDSHLNAGVFAAGAELGIGYEMVEELYQGQHGSDEDFAYQLADEMGLVPEGNDWPASYIDWERAAYDLMMDYGQFRGHYFRTSY